MYLMLDLNWTIVARFISKIHHKFTREILTWKKLYNIHYSEAVYSEILTNLKAIVLNDIT